MTDEELIVLMAEAHAKAAWPKEDGRNQMCAVLSALHSFGLAVVQDWSTDMREAPERGEVQLLIERPADGDLPVWRFTVRGTRSAAGSRWVYRSDDPFTSGRGTSHFGNIPDGYRVIAWAPLLPVPSEKEGGPPAMIVETDDDIETFVDAFMDWKKEGESDG